MAKPRRKSEWQDAARSLGLDTSGTIPTLRSRIAQFSDYNATADKQRRQAPSKRVTSENVVLTPKKRRRLNATALDQLRNHALPAWMVRKHLDYTSSFHISVNTGSDKLDVLIERIFRWHGRPENFSVSGRLGRDESFRLFEREKVVNGDAAFIKSDDIKLQGVESDMIALGAANENQERPPKEVNSEGLVIDQSSGAVEQYCICNRGGRGSEVVYDHMEDAENVIFDGYWSRFTSQYRGISPLSTALNTVQDIAEAFEFNLIKAKMHALFGVAIMRDTGGNPEMGGAAGALSEVAGASSTDAQTELNLDPGTVNMLDMNRDDDVKVFESGTPSTEFVNGSYLFIQCAMLALDFPITCFDSRRSSFSGRIADLNEYEVSAEHKRTKNRYVRQNYSDWVLWSIWNDPEDPWRLRSVANEEGFNTLRPLQERVEWVPNGSPWLDKLKQIQGDKLAIETGIDNPIDAARRRGKNVFKNLEKTARVQEYARELGVPLMYGASGQKSVEEIVADAVIAMNEAEAGAEGGEANEDE